MEICRSEHSCAKELYVSPFVPMDCTYHFHIAPPDEGVLVRIDETDADGLLLRASFAGKRQPLNDRTLLRALLAHPLMTLKVSCRHSLGSVEALAQGRARSVPHEKGGPAHRHDDRPVAAGSKLEPAE